MTSIMHSAAVVVPVLPRSKKKSGTPIRSAAPKQSSCRFVRLKSTLDFTRVKSLGTVTYAIFSMSSFRLMRVEYGF